MQLVRNPGVAPATGSILGTFHFTGPQSSNPGAVSVIYGIMGSRVGSSTTGSVRGILYFERPGSSGGIEYGTYFREGIFTAGASSDHGADTFTGMAFVVKDNAGLATTAVPGYLKLIAKDVGGGLHLFQRDHTGADIDLAVGGTAPYAGPFTLSNYPPSNDCSVIIASNATPHQFGFGYIHGNGLWLYSPTRNQSEFTIGSGAGDLVDIRDCVIDDVAHQAIAARTLYHVYAYEAATEGGFMRVQLSTVPPQGGDPLGALKVTGWLYKGGASPTLNQRYIGAVWADIAQPSVLDPPGTTAPVLWRAGTRGVYHSGIASLYHRQRLNYHIKPGGSWTSISWTEINSNQYLAALIFGDGAEPFINLSGYVQSSAAGAVVSVGISKADGAGASENPPFDYADIYCAIANQPYPFSVTQTAGDFGDDMHWYRIFGKTTAGSASLGAGSTFSMKLEQ
jgi:hypothetical protein